MTKLVKAVLTITVEQNTFGLSVTPTAIQFRESVVKPKDPGLFSALVTSTPASAVFPDYY